MTARAEGQPWGDTVASTIASDQCSPVARASSHHVRNRTMGSAGTWFSLRRRKPTGYWAFEDQPVWC
jgi:hypothetical protein